MTPPYGSAGCRCFYWDRYDVPGVPDGTWGWEASPSCPLHGPAIRPATVTVPPDGTLVDLPPSFIPHHDEAALCPTWGAVPVAVGDAVAVSFECRCAYGCAWVGEIGPHGHVLDDEGDPVCVIEGLDYEKEIAWYSANRPGRKIPAALIRGLKRWLTSSKRTRNSSG